MSIRGPNTLDAVERGGDSECAYYPAGAERLDGQMVQPELLALNLRSPLLSLRVFATELLADNGSHQADLHKPR